MSRAMSRSGRPPLAGGSAAAGGKSVGKFSSKRAIERAKLLPDLGSGSATLPASHAAAPSTPTVTTRSKRYALRSAEKSIAETPTEHSSPGGSGGDPSELSASIGTGEDSEGGECSSSGDQRMEIQRRQQDAALSTVAPVLPPPREVVFQPTNNHDPGVKEVEVNTQVTPAIGGVADSVLDDLFNTWRCGSCTYQNLGKAIGACTMCNNPHPIQTPLSLDPWEIGELEARVSVVVPTIQSIFADSPRGNAILPLSV
jgi:hypothetical protein